MSENYKLKLTKDIEIKFSELKKIEDISVFKIKDKTHTGKDIKIKSITLDKNMFEQKWLSTDDEIIKIKISQIKQISGKQTLLTGVNKTPQANATSTDSDQQQASTPSNANPSQKDEETDFNWNNANIQKYLQEGELKLKIDWSRSWFSNESEVWISEIEGIKLDENNIEEIKKEMFITNAYPHIWWMIPFILLVAGASFLAYWYFIWNKEEISEDEKNEEDLITETI